MKPRIIWTGGYWRCSGHYGVGFGRTPGGAYASWQNSMLANNMRIRFEAIIAPPKAK